MPSRSKKVIITGVTKVILVALGAGAIIGVTLLFPGVGYIYREFKRQQWEEAKKRGSLRSTIKRLEKQELISWKETPDGKLKLTLTERGEKRVLQYKIDQLELKELKRDGLWRVIVFDIPEKKRVVREIFREKLKTMGFYKLQKSVFVTPYECKDEIDFLRHALEIPANVHYIIAKEISGLELKNLQS